MRNRTLIIAEAGVNHNGDINLAKRLVDVAKDAGADYVKFQTFKSKKLVSKLAQKAKYQKRNTNNEAGTQLEMLKKLELSKKDHYELLEYCNEQKIKFLSTGFDLGSISFLHELGIDLFKIPSGEITNLPYLRLIGSLGKPIIISTGMSDMNEIEEAFNALVQAGASKNEITILHCNTEYPTPMKDVNLSAMTSINKKFDVKIGYSDHTLGIEIPIAAVALGAKIIEKHFTVDNTLDGPDHQASLEPHELKKMVTAIRNIEVAMGDGIKQPSPSEKKNKTIARKSIVASKPIKKNDLFTEENLTVKRPGSGISPMQWDSVLGTKARKDYEEDDLI